MRHVTLFAAAILLAASAASASANATALITGSIYDDPQGISLPERFLPVAGATVRIYRDGGDGIPSAGDVLTATATTSQKGDYSFSVPSGGMYWIAVDSKTIGRGTSGRAWPEQTFGPAGALCAQPDGTSRTNYVSGACIGGRRADVSDEPSSLVTAEHVAAIRADASVRGVDFAFSYNVVSNAGDSSADATPVQGSLRQFIENANAIKGANVMRFVPIAPPSREEVDVMLAERPRWWFLRSSRQLPAITDDETVVDGTAYSFLSPVSVNDQNPGKAGLRPALSPLFESTASQEERPELEIATTGDEGLSCTARCVIRMIAIHGPRVSIVTRADATVEHVMIGAQADATATADAGEVGLQVERGHTTAEQLLIYAQKTAGLAVVGRESTVDAKLLDVAYCGAPPSKGAAVAFLSDGSSLRYSVLHQNEGAGVVIGEPETNAPATGNVLDSNTFTRNAVGVVLSHGASGNTIVRNRIIWNAAGGVVAALNEGPAPHANRISENDYNENGLRPIILTRSEDMNSLFVGSPDCNDDPTRANGGLAPPKITVVRRDWDRAEGEVFLIRGTGCKGRTVEIYRSFVTAAVRRASDSPEIRKKRKKNEDGDETLTIIDSGIRAVQSVGEFNFVGSALIADDGSFELKVPLTRLMPRRRSKDPVQFQVWADESLGVHDPNDSAFSALTIDAEGNTSELSSRHAARKSSKAKPPGRE